MNLTKKLIVTSLSTFLVCGCVGIDSTAFYTKSNVGIEVSTTPPAVGVNIARDEGVVTPQFEGGKTLPVLASFKNTSDGLFSGQIGATFATGNAALTMATLYNSPTEGEVAESQLELSSAPRKSSSDQSNPLQKTDIRPVFFSTKTSVGLNISWSGLTATLPDSFTLGYNRKELAVLPVTYSKDKNNKHFVKQASLLATLGYVYSDLDSFPSTDASDKPEQMYLQYFATGKSASKMATHPEVRMAMINRLDPSTGVELNSNSLTILPAMKRLIEQIAENDKYAAELLKKVNANTYTMSDGYSSMGIVNYIEPDPAGTTVDQANIVTNANKDFDDLYQYVISLGEDLTTADKVLKFMEAAKTNKDGAGVPQPIAITYNDAAGAVIWNRVPTDNDINAEKDNIIKLQNEYLKHYKILISDSDVIELFKYASNKAAKGV